MRFSISAVISALALGFAARAPAQNRNAEATAVIFNSADPLSAELGNYYAERRGIPKAQVIGLPCGTTEEITREQYDNEIAEPLRRIFDAKGWWEIEKAPKFRVVRNKIRFVALIRGVPLKIKPVADYPGDQPASPPFGNQNAASVDSELTMLAMRELKISGAIVSPYYRSFALIQDAGLPSIMLVCRLDGPTGTQVRRMIDDALQAEKTGVWGFAYIDTRDTKDLGLQMGDQWLRGAAEDAKRHGIPVVLERASGMFPENYPMRNAAFYYGWYAENASGPFVRAGFKFNQGAVAAHIHSYSASTVRSPTANWVGPLIMAGAAATFGNVYEPYLPLTTQMDIFQDRLRNGFTFAESGYMATNSLSWMSTFVGDPLYRPFAIFQDLGAKYPESAAEFVAYREGALAWFNQGRPKGEKLLRDSGNTLKSGIIFEGLASLQADAKDFTAALESSRLARQFYRNPEDSIRLALREANLLAGTNRHQEAMALLRKTIRDFSDAPASAALVGLRDELEPPPTPPPVPQPAP